VCRSADQSHRSSESTRPSPVLRPSRPRVEESLYGPLGRCFLGLILRLFALSSAGVTVPAIVSRQMFSLIWDMSCKGCDPIQYAPLTGLSRGLEDRIHLRAVEDCFALWLIAHLLVEEGGTEDILGPLFPLPLFFSYFPPVYSRLIIGIRFSTGKENRCRIGSR